MEKTYQLSDFVSFFKQANGQYRIVCSASQEGNIYRWLKTVGFGRTVIDGKPVTFRKVSEDVKPAKFWQMNDVFHQFLEEVSCQDLPEGLSRIDLLDWYLSKSPLKQNGLYRHCLQSTLSGADVHLFKMNTESLYRHRYQVDQVMDMLAANDFKRAEDVAGTVSKGLTLYYRQLPGHQFLVFSHYNARHKNPYVDGFDCWLASFRNEQQIGTIQTKSLKDIRLSFQYERDYALIAPYLSR